MKTPVLFMSAIIAFSISSNSRLNAQDNSKQDDRKHAINICALAIPLMHMYVGNYEYLYKTRHGLAVRIEYVPNMEGADTKGDAYAGVLNYRYHLSPKLGNFFVGAYARYRYAYGSGIANETNYKFEVPEANLGLNGGFRWVTKIGFNAVFSAGYGYSFVEDRLTPSTQEVVDNFDTFKNANSTNSAIFDSPYYAEFSIGYVF